MPRVSYYAGGLDPNRVLVALALPCIAATLGVGVECGVLSFTLQDALFLGALFALAGAALACGLTLMVFAALGDRAGPKPLHRAPAARAQRHQGFVLARR